MLTRAKKLSLLAALVLLLALATTGCGAVDAVRSLLASLTPTPTSTPAPSPTFTPSPSVTPSPAAALQLFVGQGFEIMLPDTYAGGSSPEEIRTIIDSLRNGGSQLVVQLAEQNKNNIRLFAIDSQTSLVFRTSMIVFGFQNPLFRGGTAALAAQIFKAPLLSLFPGSAVIDEGPFAQSGLDGYRFVTVVDSATLGFDENVVAAIVSYVFLKDDFLWVVVFATPQRELENRMSEFDASAASFRTISQ